MAAASGAASHKFSFESLTASDAALKSAPTPAKFRALPAPEVVARTAEALKKNGWSVTVVRTGAEALEALKGFAKPDASYSAGSSISLEQVGWTEWLKANPAAFGRNFKSEAVAADAKGDHAAAGAARAEGARADYYFSSVSAITEAGDAYVADQSGTRVTGFLAAKHIVVLASAQKIVPTFEDAVARTKELALPVESARVRIVYGAPASAIVNTVALSAYNPWAAPGARHIVLVTDELLGY